MNKKEFVNEFGKLLNIAKSNLVSCELIEDKIGEIVIVTCGNGHKYRVNVTGNGLAAIMCDVLKAVAYK